MTRLPHRALRLFSVLLVLALPAAAAAQSAPGFSAAFSPDTIAPGGISTLTFTISNSGSASPADSLAFSGTLPASVTIGSSGSSDSCGGSLSASAGGSTITYADGRLGAGSSCTVAVPVTASAAGSYSFTSGDLTSSLGNSGTASDTLTAAASSVSVTQSVSLDTLDPGSSTTLTYVIENNSGSATAVSLSLTLPAGLELATPANAASSCGGTLTASSGGGSFAFAKSGAFLGFVGGVAQFDSLEDGGSCTVTAEIRGTDPGDYDLTTAWSASLNGSGSTTSAVTVNAPPEDGIGLFKAFAVSQASAGETVTLDFSLSNTSRDNSASGIAFTDDLDAFLSGTAFSSLNSDSCGGSLSGSSTLSYTGGSLASGGTCVVSVELALPAGAAAGSYTNTTSAVTASDFGGSAYAGSAASATLRVLADGGLPVSLTKAFTDGPVQPGGTITARYTLSNPNTALAASDIAFSEPLDTPGGIAVSALPSANFCGSGSTLYTADVSGTTTLLLSSGSLAAGASCSFDVVYQTADGTAPGDYATAASAPTATVNGASVSATSGASATLTVAGGANLQLVKTFGADTAKAGTTTGLSFTISSSAESAATATGISFTDDLDAFLSGTTFSSLTSDSCGGSLSGSSTLSYTGGSLDPGESCTIAVEISLPAGASGSYTNTTSSLSATAGGEATTAAAASGTLQVLEAQPLQTARSFSPASVLPGETVTLTYTLENPDSSLTYSDVYLTDGYSSALSSLAADGSASASFSAGCGPLARFNGTSTGNFTLIEIAPGATCTISLDLTVPSGAADGDYSFSYSSLTASLNGAPVTLDGIPGTLTVSTSDTIELSKSYSSSLAAAGSALDVEYTVTNLSGRHDVTALAFSDSFEGGMVVAATPNATTSCTGGTLTAAAGADSISYSGGSVAQGTSCTVSISLTAPTAAGSYSGATSTLTGTASGATVTGVAASAALTVQAGTPPGFAKSFAASALAAGSSTTLSYEISNPADGSALTGLRFTEDLDAMLSGLAVTGGTGSGLCGSGSIVSGSSTVEVSGASLEAGESCTIALTVAVPAGAATGSYSGSTSALNSDAGEAAGAASAGFSVEPAPDFSAAFGAASIVQGGSATLTYTVDNSASAIAASSLDFTTALPAGLEVAAAPNASTSCTGGTLSAAAGAGSLSYTGGTAAAGASCTVSVDLRATVPGTLSSTSGSLTSSSGGSGTAAASLTVTAAPLPGFAAAFGDASIVLGGTSRLTLTVDNSAALIAAGALDVTVPLPAGLVVAPVPDAAATCTGGTLTAAAGSSSLSYTGGTVAAGASCTIAAELRALSTGTLSLTSGDLTSDLGNSGTAAAGLAVTAAPVPGFTKSFAAASVPLNGSTTMTLTVDNSAALIEAGALDVTDSLPAGMTVASPANASATCTGGTLSAAAGAGSISYSGGTVAAGSSCTVQVDVTAAVPGALVNTTGDLTSSLGNSGTAQATLTVPALSLSAPIATDDVVNASEAAALTIPGSTEQIEDGQSVTVTVTDSAAGSVSGSATVAGGAWSLNLDISGLADGSLTVTADASDAAGSAAPQASAALSKDATAPAGYSAAFDQAAANAANEGAASFTFAGAEPGASYSYTVSSSGGGSDVTGTGTLASATDQVAGLDLSGLADGTLTLSVTLSDAAGNTGAAAADSIAKDTAAPALAFASPLATDDAVNASEAAAVALSGTAGSIEDGQSVTVTVTDSAAGSASGSATVAGGAWSLTLDLSGLADGSLSLTAEASDAAGNAAPQAAAALAKDTEAPAGYSAGFDQDPLNAADAGAASFTFAGGEPGAAYSYTVSSSGGGSDVSGTGTLASATDQVAGLDLSGLADGTLTLSVTLTDAAGNAGAAAADSIAKDTAAPALAFASPLATDDAVNASEAAAVALSGTAGSIEDGQSVTVTVTDSAAGSASGSATVAGGAWSLSLDLSGLADGSLSLTAEASDAAGNAAPQAAAALAKDTEAPAAVLSGPEDAQSGAFAVTLAFSEEVTGFALDGLELDNGTASDLSGAGASYSFTVTPEHDGSVTITAGAGAASDASGNASAAAGPLEVSAALTGTPDPDPLPDADGDGIPDSFESATADRDGDGIPDAEDYDPQGYFYCEDDGRILAGASITVTGPSGSNSSVGILNDINIVRDGSSGEYQWFAQRPGTYTVIYGYPAGAGAASTARLSAGSLDVTSLLPDSPAVIGSTQVGATGFLADAGLSANPVFYDTFVIEAGDPHVLANNIPMTQCAENPVTVSAAQDGAEANGASPSAAAFTVSLARSAAVDTVISYTLAGSAAAGEDYTAPSGTVTIAAGETAAEIALTVLEDGAIEGAETVELTLTAVVSGDLTTALSGTAAELAASAAIADDDFAVIAVSNDDLTASENGEDTAAMSFRLLGAPAADVVLSFRGDSQCSVAPAQMTFTSGNFAAAQTLAIRAIDDETAEGSHSCQPAVSVRSADAGFDGTALTLAQVQVSDDLVDQVREQLTAVLKQDLEETVKTQQRHFSRMAKGALARLRAGDEDLRCGTLKAFDTDGTLQVQDGDGASEGSFGWESYNCNTGMREILDGSFTLSHSDGLGTQAMLQAARQSERFLSPDDLRGYFWGGYLSRTSVQDRGDGTVTGFGLNGGIYGARGLGGGLFLDYYAAAALGHHRFDLDFDTDAAPVRAEGDYQYAAGFAGAALSGRRDYGSMTVRPRAGLDLAYAAAGDADVTASQLAQRDTGTIRLPDYSGARLFAEVEFAGLEPAAADTAPGSTLTYLSFAPRVACELSSFDSSSSDTGCGLGFAFSQEMLKPGRGLSFGLDLDYEHIDGSDRLSAGVSRERRFANGRGAVVSRLTLPAAGALAVTHGVELDF